uniref:PLD phosphodiesterase domain-containing protein n=1 Tax=Esox lucius TaxID=8010 RepID=A0A3P8ZEG2_ESOLU
MMDDGNSPPLSEDDRTKGAGEADSLLEVTDARNWTVMLERIDPEEDSEKKGDEEKDTRKTGKQPASRIPAFRKTLAKKQPTSSSQSSDPAVPPPSRKEPFNQSASTSTNVEAMSRSKMPSIRETSLPLPSVRLTRINPDTLSHNASSLEQTITSLDLTPSDEDENLHPMTATARPALRMETGDWDDPEDALHTSQDLSTSSENPSQTYSIAAEAAKKDPEDGLKWLKHQYKRHQTEYVVETQDKRPPREAEAMEFEFVLNEDNASLEKEFEMTKPYVEAESFKEPQVVSGKNQGNLAKKGKSSEKRSEFPPKVTNVDTTLTSSRAVNQTTKLSSPSNKTSWCWSFAVFCLFPSILLVIGGFGQHVWHYGMPMSVSQLMGQLELHWLEGLWVPHQPCGSDCRVSLVESIPEGLVYPSGSASLPSISKTWIDLLNQANSSVDVAAFYLTLRDSALGITEPSAAEGKEVFMHLMELEAKGVKLHIAVNGPQTDTKDTEDLSRKGAEVREVDLQSVTGGIIHTKLWVVDQKNLYLGSANMDWRSLTQVKEVGVSMEDCSCLAQDASRIFGVYWNIGAQKNGSLPPFWPARYSALSSSKNPLNLKLNGVPARVYLSSAPPQISAYGRSDDLSTILAVIEDAQRFVHISVMDFLPMSQFTKPLRFWPVIDTALKAAACTRGVEVNLLVSCWAHSPGSMFVFLQSMAVLNRPPLQCNINVKVFEVPSTPEQEKIPFSRVNHAKYMVTDRVAYIGTSNWSENYFTQTAGVGLVVNQTGSLVREGQRTLQTQLEEVFQRDWASRYASWLSMDDFACSWIFACRL